MKGGDMFFWDFGCNGNLPHLSSQHLVEQHTICPPIHGAAVWLVRNDLHAHREQKRRILYEYGILLSNTHTNINIHVFGNSTYLVFPLFMLLVHV